MGLDFKMMLIRKILVVLHGPIRDELVNKEECFIWIALLAPWYQNIFVRAHCNSFLAGGGGVRELWVLE